MEFQEKQVHRCSFCGYKSPLNLTFEDHIRLHTREKPFLCDQCNRGFSRKRGLNEHKLCRHQGIKKVHENKYKCALCPYATHHKSTWENHVQAHTGERSFPCHHSDCQYVAKTSGTLRMHSLNKHKLERRYMCQFPNCGYRGKTTALLKQHYQKHSDDRSFFCDFEGCSYRAKRKQYLQRHKRDVHNDGYKPFACSVCSYHTTTRHNLSRHALTHMKDKSVKCNFSGCNFSCKTNKSLTFHVLNRHTDKKFKCDVKDCLSTAASLLKLNVHKKLVHSEKAYKCPKCVFRAAIPSRLQAHIFRRHSASKRIKCPTKGCTFQAKHHLTLIKHLQYHRANLGCPLDGCGYVGHSSSSLNRHMQLHDPMGRPFRCPLCPKNFCKNVVLSRHLKTHTREKPFQCPACNHGTTTKMHIIAHVRAFHPTISSKFDEDSVCNHCNVDFGCAYGLAVHGMKVKTAVVALARLQLKI